MLLPSKSAMQILLVFRYLFIWVPTVLQIRCLMLVNVVCVVSLPVCFQTRLKQDEWTGFVKRCSVFITYFMQFTLYI